MKYYIAKIINIDTNEKIFQFLARDKKEENFADAIQVFNDMLDPFNNFDTPWTIKEVTLVSEKVFRKQLELGTKATTNRRISSTVFRRF